MAGVIDDSYIGVSRQFAEIDQLSLELDKAQVRLHVHDIELVGSQCIGDYGSIVRWIFQLACRSIVGVRDNQSDFSASRIGITANNHTDQEHDDRQRSPNHFFAPSSAHPQKANSANESNEIFWTSKRDFITMHNRWHNLLKNPAFGKLQ
jgi:hypothetical protein